MKVKIFSFYKILVNIFHLVTYPPLHQKAYLGVYVPIVGAPLGCIKTHTFLEYIHFSMVSIQFLSGFQKYSHKSWATNLDY